LDKWQARCEHENKRFYWRDNHLKHFITRAARSDQDTLQWLIYVESVAFEIKDEENGRIRLRSMIVRYIKELVRIASGMSSFYMGVAIQRLLYAYTTEENQRSYEALTDRFHGADEYRRAKGILMRRLQHRFSCFLSGSTGRNGEQRFRALEGQQRWTALARTCLSAFVPWSTRNRCLIQKHLTADGHVSALFTGEGRERSFQDEVEINRYHVFIDPTCFSVLADALNFDTPSSRLLLPCFTGIEDEDQDEGQLDSGRLTSDERTHLECYLHWQNRRRSR
jgi:hypothetical protein